MQNRPGMARQHDTTHKMDQSFEKEGQPYLASSSNMGSTDKGQEQTRRVYRTDRTSGPLLPALGLAELENRAARPKHRDDRTESQCRPHGHDQRAKAVEKAANHRLDAQMRPQLRRKRRVPPPTANQRLRRGRTGGMDETETTRSTTATPQRTWIPGTHAGRDRCSDREHERRLEQLSLRRADERPIRQIGRRARPARARNGPDLVEST